MLQFQSFWGCLGSKVQTVRDIPLCFSKYVQRYFFQVYLVHIRTNQQVIPCIYGLLPNKNQNTYNRFFQEIFIKVAAIGNLPTSMLFDFHVASINSFSGILPNTSKSGCFYHLSVNRSTKIQYVSLQERCNNDPEFALHLLVFTKKRFFRNGSEKTLVRTLERNGLIISNQVRFLSFFPVNNYLFKVVLTN